MTPRKMEILKILSNSGRATEDELKTSYNLMMDLFYGGYVKGGGTDDDRGTGNYPWSRVWWITDKGRAFLDGSVSVRDRGQS